MKKNFLRKFKNKFFNTTNTKDSQVKTIIVAGSELNVFTYSSLVNWYNKYPYYNGQLADLIKIIRRKYSSAGYIDVGANIGDTLAIIKNAADVKSICIEGDKIVYQLLERNITQFEDVVCLNKFLGDKHEFINAATEKKGWNTTIIPVDKDTGEKIEIETLDEVMNNFKDIADYKLLKIDAEGYDAKIIRGAFNFINKVTPIIFLEYNRENMDRIYEPGIPTLNTLHELGYKYVFFYEGLGRFIISTLFEDKKLIQQLHNYADGKSAAIKYFDLCLFHSKDEDIAEELLHSYSKQ